MAEKVRAKVTMTKNEIYALYKAHIDEINAANSGVENVKSTSEVAKDKAVSAAVSNASALTLDSAKAFIDNFFATLDDKVAEYNSIDTAIAAKKAELKEVLGIEVEANSLLAIIKSKSEYAASVDAECEEKIAAADAKLAETNQNIADVKAAELQDRKRRNEEWEYNFARETRNKQNELADKLALEARSLDSRKAELETLSASIGEREVLEQKLAAAQAAQDEAVKSAEKRATAIAENSAKQDAKLIEAQHKAEITVKDARIASLESENLSLNERLTDILAKLEAANDRIVSVSESALKAGADKQTITEISSLFAQGVNAKR